MTPRPLSIASLGPDRMPATLVNHAKAQAQAVPLTELSAYSADQFDVLAVTSHVDQRGLQRQAYWLTQFLDIGGILLWNGPVAHSPLADLQSFVPQPKRNLAGLTVQRLAEHPLMAHINAEDLTFRRGVAGFWGRGHNPAPAGALLLNGLGEQPQQAPVDWLWQRPLGGWILMHAGNDWLSFAQAGTPAEQLVDNLIDWALEVRT